MADEGGGGLPSRWKGEPQICIDDYAMQKSDAVATSTLYWKGSHAEAKSKFNEFAMSTEYTNVTMSLGLDGTASVSGVKHVGMLNTNVVSSANTNISLVAVPLIQHPRFSGLLTETGMITIGSEGGGEGGSEGGSDGIPVQKAIQEYIHIDPYREKDRMKELGDAIGKYNNKYLEYCKRIISGQTDFLQPQATFSARFWSVDLQLDNPAPVIVGGLRPGEVGNPPDNTFLNVDGWDCLYSGYQEDFSSDRSGYVTLTWQGVPKYKGGQWDRTLYSGSE